LFSFPSIEKYKEHFALVLGSGKILLFPARESLIGDIPAGDGKNG
jgi:hypothetical protein